MPPAFCRSFARLALVDDIKAHGLQDDIAMFEGAILDGRNRYRACKNAGREPRFKDVNPADPVQYVHSENLHRRQLTRPQLGMVAARTIAYYAEDAKKRMAEGGRKGGEKSKDPRALDAQTTQSKGKGMATWPYPSDSSENEGKSETTHPARDDAGAAVGVSGQTVQRSVRVLDYGSPDLVQAVDAGKLASNTAANLTYLTNAQQDEAAPRTPKPWQGCWGFFRFLPKRSTRVAPANISPTVNKKSLL